MPYTVLARKYRPQRFAEVVGQRAVVQTLQNALRMNRVAHAFLFAGPRGVGKTTTARILARALNCVNGPTAEPCGVCDACRDIAEGRSIDVLEIDAASNTGVENVREVIINGITITPARDRYKIFIIDEVHMLSASSFNALLKTLEEPPPHAVFILATTELHKIPDTILSRCQEHEFRAIPTRDIAATIREIARAENLTIDDAALALIARSAEGSLRDAQSALDQVLAFSGERITQEDVAAVLGLVGRDLVLEMASAVDREDAAAIFTLVDRAVSGGHDLRLVCRELVRLVRDLLVLQLDPSAAAEVLDGGSEPAAMRALQERFSADDLLRAFDLLTRADGELRYSPHPRYHLEMTLLKWLHLCKLVPLADLIARFEGGARPPGPAAGPPAAGAGRAPQAASAGAPQPARAPQPVARGSSPSASAPPGNPRPAPAETHEAASGEESAAATPGDIRQATATDGVRESILQEIRRVREPFYRMCIQQADAVVLDGDRLVFRFTRSVFKDKIEGEGAFVERTASQIAGRPIKVVAELVGAPAGTAGRDAAPPRNANAPVRSPGATEAAVPSDPAADLKERALKNPAVQSLLDVFGADIRSVEKLE